MTRVPLSSPSATAPRLSEPFRVMLVDDSPTVRMITKRWLSGEKDIEIVASCRNGLEALQNLRRNRIEVVILDIEMPQMNGLQALPEIFKVTPNVKVIMSSTLTTRNADISMRCLELGATDYIPKPTNGAELSDSLEFRRDLIDKIRALGQSIRKQDADAYSSRSGSVREGRPRPARAAVPLKGEIKTVAASSVRPQIIGIGSSTGGPNALMDLLKDLDPRKMPPIVITQHMPSMFTTVLAEHISRKTRFVCKEGSDGTLLVPGHVYVAPGNYHMIVVQKAGQKQIAITNDEPENFCKPAVDPLFRSLAEVYGRSVLAIMLTGMGHDGRDGARQIVESGGTLIAQDEASSVVWGMPGAVAQEGICHKILPLKDIPHSVTSFFGAR